MFSAKGGKDWVTPESFYRTLLMLFGTAHVAVLVALTALTICGRRARRAARARAWSRICRRSPSCGVTATILARPRWIHHPLVAARYLIPLLPFLLCSPPKV